MDFSHGNVMPEEITDASNGLTYRLCGDYYLPMLKTDAPIHIGLWGRMRWQYLKQYRPVLYAQLIMSGKLQEHLAETDRAAYERMEVLVHKIAKKESVMEELKAADQMAWVGAMNGIAQRAREIITNELIYS